MVPLREGAEFPVEPLRAAGLQRICQAGHGVPGIAGRGWACSRRAWRRRAMFDYVLGAAAAAFLMVYLVYALLRPEDL